MAMHTSTANTEIILAREFKTKSDPRRTHVLLDHGKDKKCSSKHNCNDSGYHVKDIKDVSHIIVKISYATTPFSALSFCGLHAKPRGVKGLSKHYHLRIDPKLGHGKCTV